MAQLGITQRDSSQAKAHGYAVELRHVKKSHGVNEVYTDLHFQLLHGTFVALVGPIGSGKTTLINLLAGLERPDDGTIIVEGQDITRMGDDQLAAYRGKTIGLVPQVQTLIPELTTYENVELPLYFQGLAREARWGKVSKIIDRVGLSGDANRLVGSLSVGEKQMVSFARALVADPPILLLDEPTESLDPLMSEMVLGYLRGDNLTGKTIFVTTHDKRVIELAKRTIRVKKQIP
jgi:putative ABC transport system ATP-binding protein